MLKIIFLFLMAGGIPVAVAMAGSALLYIWWTGNLPPFVVIHRMVSGIDSFPLLAVPFFILAGNLMNNAGITNRIYNYALALVGWLKGGLGHVNVVGSVVFAGNERHRHCRCSRPGHDRDQGHDRPWLQQGICRGRDGGVGHAGAHHPAQPAVCDLRNDGQRERGRAVPGGHFAGRADGCADDADGGVFRAPERLGRRHQV